MYLYILFSLKTISILHDMVLNIVGRQKEKPIEVNNAPLLYVKLEILLFD